VGTYEALRMLQDQQFQLPQLQCLPLLPSYFGSFFCGEGNSTLYMCDRKMVARLQKMADNSSNLMNEVT
jgi:hypothetical protein